MNIFEIWDNWFDVGFTNYGGVGYLIQCRISKTNKKQFNLVPIQEMYGISKACALYQSITNPFLEKVDAN